MTMTIVIAEVVCSRTCKVVVVQNINTVSQCRSLTVCVGECSRRSRWSAALVRRRQATSSLVIRQWRSRVGRWLGLAESSHSTAEQSTTTTRRPRRHRLSSQAVESNTIMLQRTHITTLRCTQQQQWVVVAVWRHVAICCTLT